MLALLNLIPLRAGLIGAAVVAALCGMVWLRSSLIEQGRADAAAAITRANDAAETKADAAQRDVYTCPPGHWNKDSGTCDQ